MHAKLNSINVAYNNFTQQAVNCLDSLCTDHYFHEDVVFEGFIVYPTNNFQIDALSDRLSLYIEQNLGYYENTGVYNISQITPNTLMHSFLYLQTWYSPVEVILTMNELNSNPNKFGMIKVNSQVHIPFPNISTVHNTTSNFVNNNLLPVTLANWQNDRAIVIDCNFGASFHLTGLTRNDTFFYIHLPTYSTTVDVNCALKTSDFPNYVFNNISFKITANLPSTNLVYTLVSNQVTSPSLSANFYHATDLSTKILQRSNVNINVINLDISACVLNNNIYTNGTITISKTYDWQNKKLNFSFGGLNQLGKYQLVSEKVLDFYFKAGSADFVISKFTDFPNPMEVNVSYDIYWVPRDLNDNPTSTSQPPTLEIYNGATLVTSFSHIDSMKSTKAIDGIVFSECYAYQISFNVMGTYDYKWVQGVSERTGLIIVDSVSCNLPANIYTAPDGCFENCLLSTYQYRLGNECFAACPVGAPLNDPDKLCHASCVSALPNIFKSGSSCLPSCPVNHYYDSSNVCHSNCQLHQSEQFTYNNTCKIACPVDKPLYDLGKVCYSNCADASPAIYQNTNECSNLCAVDTPKADPNNVCHTQCINLVSNPYTDGDRCVPSCPLNKPYYDSSNVCHSNCQLHQSEQFTYNNTCKIACPVDKPLYDLGKVCYSNCADASPAIYQNTNECSNLCAVDTPKADPNNVCHTQCINLVSNPYTDGDRCVPSCPLNKPYYDSSKLCLAACVDSIIDHYTDGFNCKYLCPPGQVFDINKICYTSCLVSPHPYTRGSQCVDFCLTDEYEDPNKICYTHACPLEFRYVDGRFCKDSCPLGKLVDPLGTCIDVCYHQYPYRQQDKCLDVCLAGSKADSTKICRNPCPEAEPYSDDIHCYPTCPLGTLPDPTLKCHSTCPHNYRMIENGKCVSECGENFPLRLDNTCLSSCPTYAHFNAGNECLKRCPAQMPYHNPKHDEKICLETCPFFFNYQYDCMDECPPHEPYYFPSKVGPSECLKNCDSGVYTSSFECLKHCSKDSPLLEIMNGKKFCRKSCSENFVQFENQCIEKCPENAIEVDKKCVVCNHVIYRNNCILECPLNFIEVSNCSNCVRYCASCEDKNMLTDNGVCVKTCSFPKVKDGRNCVTCPNFIMNGQCIDSCHLPLILDEASKVCSSCPSDSFITDDNRCLKNCDGGHISMRGSTKMCIFCKNEFYFESKCYAKCPPETDPSYTYNTCAIKILNCKEYSQSCHEFSKCYEEYPGAPKCKCDFGMTSLLCHNKISDVNVTSKENVIVLLQPAKEFDKIELYEIRGLKLEATKIETIVTSKILSLIKDKSTQTLNIANRGIFELIDIYFKFKELVSN